MPALRQRNQLARGKELGATQPVGGWPGVGALPDALQRRPRQPRWREKGRSSGRLEEGGACIARGPAPQPAVCRSIRRAQPELVDRVDDLGFGRIVILEKEAPNVLVILV